jgi:hypothetical protein
MREEVKSTMRVFIGGFLIAHGLVHLAVWAMPKQAQGSPFDPSHSWLLGSAKSLSVAVAIVVALILVAGGIALFAHAELWRPITVIGLAGSLFLDVLFFNPWFAVITVVNAAFLVGLIVAHWPSQARIGA